MNDTFKEKLLAIVDDENKTHLARLEELRTFKETIGADVFQKSIKALPYPIIQDITSRYAPLLILSSRVRFGDRMPSSLINEVKERYGNEPDTVKLIAEAVELNLIDEKGW